VKRKIELCMALILLLGAIFVSKKLSTLVTSGELKEDILIVVDAGHGGKDPGKVGVNNALEKDINLQIAVKIKDLLEEQGIEVLMTREDDSSGESKMEDMKKRVDLINKAEPTIVVSIHQNSYSQENVKGAQVFYYSESEISKEAAELMQQELKNIDNTNTRSVKENSSFYMLKKTKVPTIIVECGFLSNMEEAEKLTTDSYQSTMAEAICVGILKWIDK